MGDNNKKRRLENLKKIEATSKNSRKTKWLMRVVVALLILIFLGGIAWGANDLISREEGELSPEELQRRSAESAAIEATAPKTITDIAECINAALLHAQKEKPRLRRNLTYSFTDESLDSLRFYIPGGALESVSEGQADRLRAAIRLLAPALGERFSGEDAALETQFGEGFSAHLWSLELRESTLAEDPTCTYKTYRCTAPECGHTQSEPPEECPNCDAKNAYELTYLDDYTITVLFKDAAPYRLAFLHPPTPVELSAQLGESLEDYADIQEITHQGIREASFVAVVGRAKTEEEENKLRSLRYQYDLVLRATLSFKGEFAALGSVTIDFTLRRQADFDFDWPGITLSETEYTLARRGGFTLKASQTAPEGTPILWRSSDETVVSVDAQGNVSAGKQLGTSAVVTASMEVDGVTYEDSCTVSVRNAVEKIKLNRRKLTLQQGDTYQLKATVSPRNATEKSVQWYTRDRRIALVDENGLVTARSPGTVEVYALTVDGNLKSTCTITVEGKAANDGEG